jgi:uncharacterized protein YecT (DUF1311 family)
MRFLAIAIVLISTSCFAQDSAQYRACNEKANVQFEINACASEEAARVDAELNSVYRTLLQTVKQPEYVEKIKAAERAWVVYRDAYIAAMYPAADKQAEYGSVFPTEVSNLRALLTHRQIVALREMIEQYKGA